MRGELTQDGFVGTEPVIRAATATAAVRTIPDVPASMAEVLPNVRYSSGCQAVVCAEGLLCAQGWFGVSFPRQTGSFVFNCNHGPLKASLSARRGKSHVRGFLFNAGGPADNPLDLSEVEVRRRVHTPLLGKRHPVKRHGSGQGALGFLEERRGRTVAPLPSAGPEREH